ncbi:MAG: hypothetical protein Q8O30_12100 [Candidatus Omnitrophota bacterium]|nr:hypothetical protein [Candidatus Omnitrophota bacterium]
MADTNFAKKFNRSFTPLERRPGWGFLMGLTLAEVLVVVVIVAILMGGVLKFLQTSQRSWGSGRDQLTESRQARMAITEMDKLLRQSNPDWVIGNDHYPVVISDANRRIDFYIPTFYSDSCPGAVDPALCTDATGVVHTRGELRGLSKVTFKLNPNNNTQLLEKIGIAPERVIANNVNNVNFNCGCINSQGVSSCPGCVGVDDACPVVTVSITTFVQAQHTLAVCTDLRNQNDADAGVIEAPQEGEF